MSKSRRAPGIVGAFILTVAVAACSGQASPSPSAAPSATPAPAASEAAATPSAVPDPRARHRVVRWVQYEQDTSVVEAAVKAFEDANPGVDVELSYYSYEDYSKAMPAALAAGNPPDLAFGDPTAPNTPNFVKAGQLDPLQLRSSTKYGWEDRLQPGVITFYNPLYGGETYGIPLFAAQRGIFYNKDILAKVGGTVPTTLDELEALLAKVKAAGYTPLFMGSADKYGVDYYWLGLALDYLSAGDWKAFTEGTMTWKPGTPWGGEEVRKGTERLLEWSDAGLLQRRLCRPPRGRPLERVRRRQDLRHRQRHQPQRVDPGGEPGLRGRVHELAGASTRAARSTCTSPTPARSSSSPRTPSTRTTPSP